MSERRLLTFQEFKDYLWDSYNEGYNEALAMIEVALDGAS